jgi:hypothetical protein
MANQVPGSHSSRFLLRGHNQSVIFVNKPRSSDELKDKITCRNVSISMLPYCRVQFSCFRRLSSCFYLSYRPVCITKHNVSETSLSPSSGKTYSVLSNLKTETESSHRNVVLKYKQDDVLDKNRTMDNVQKHNICTKRIVAINLSGKLKLVSPNDTRKYFPVEPKIFISTFSTLLQVR